MKRARDIAGYTLIEVLAAATVFAIAAAGLTATTVSTIKTNLLSRQTTAAAALVHDKVEQLRALDAGADPEGLQSGSHVDPQNPLTPLGNQGGKFHRAWSVVPDAPSPGLSLVTVTVSWGDEGNSAVSVDTYLCETSRCS